MKSKILKLMSIILIVISQNRAYSQDNISLYSDINYEPIPKVSLNEYKSVQLRDIKYQNPQLSLGVSVAGGGSRAQYFGLGILIGLEEIKLNENDTKNFLTEIDYFSTVSGGCYGVGYYLTVRKNLLGTSQSFKEFYFSKGEKYKDFIGKSANPLLVLNNNKNERGEKYMMTKRLDFEVLQFDALNQNNPNKFNHQMSLNDFFIKPTDSTNPTLPIFVPNGTIYNNGERIPFMPHIISALNIESSLEPNNSILPLSSKGTNDGFDFPLTYAITASSAFPGVLPKTKFGVKGKDKVICIIDGGAVENLGYTTLFELLDNDNDVKNINKKALIVDCSGEGNLERFSDDGKIKLLDLLEKTSFYTVQTKHMYHLEDMRKQLCSDSIPSQNSLVIGFSTIRDHLRNMPKSDDYEKLREQIKILIDINENWFDLYLSFRQKLITKFKEDSFKKDENGQIILASISTSKFKEFDSMDILVLYEYASQVETKLKIYADERDMLIIAGRYTVFLEQEKLKSLLKTE